VSQGRPEEDAPRVVIRDKRRIDPVTGQVRTPAGEQPAGVPGAAGPGHRGEQMSEQENTGVEQPAATAQPAGGTPQPVDGAAQPGGGADDDGLAAQLAERTQDLQRVTAEYANYRRRVDRDRQLVVDQAAERFATQLFPIVDDIQRARDHGDLTGAFKVVADRVLGVLDGLGVAAFGTAGDPFDPALHEAVMHDTSSDVDVPTATTVLRQGFRRGDRVLRTAMVAVSEPERPPAAPVDEAAEPQATDQPGATAAD
jgi:molecular chaperone GrpE